MFSFAMLHDVKNSNVLPSFWATKNKDMASFLETSLRIERTALYIRTRLSAVAYHKPPNNNNNHYSFLLTNHEDISAGWDPTMTNYTLIKFSSFKLTTLNHSRLGSVRDTYACRQLIKVQAYERAKKALQLIEPSTKEYLVCRTIIRLAEHCVCEIHPRRPKAVEYITTRWLADYSETLKDNQDRTTAIAPGIGKSLQNTQQLEETIQGLRREKKALETTIAELKQDIDPLGKCSKKQVTFLADRLTLSREECRQLHISASGLAERLSEAEYRAYLQESNAHRYFTCLQERVDYAELVSLNVSETSRKELEHAGQHLEDLESLLEQRDIAIAVLRAQLSKYTSDKSPSPNLTTADQYDTPQQNTHAVSE
ncbi:hypothetical protein E4T42_06857 [Aureobasidium subglaciale]|nr:hypothetical protein E4T42_06857 [Aureobasidium subglaciale]